MKCVMALHVKFTAFYRPNIISGGPTNGLSIHQLTGVLQVTQQDLENDNHPIVLFGVFRFFSSIPGHREILLRK